MRTFCLLVLLVRWINPVPIEHYFREEYPRFKSIQPSRLETYLGNDEYLNCHSVSQSPVTVEWYRNGQLLEKEMFFSGRIRPVNKHMALEIRSIDVSDQGLWSCRVYNNYAQITRNFTIEVIDFCDYFLIPQIQRAMIPMECICLWKFSREVKRVDVDYKVATESSCKKYESRMFERLKKPLPAYPCFDEPCGSDSNVTHVTLDKDVKDEHAPVTYLSNPVKLFDWLVQRPMVEDVSHLIPQLVSPTDLKKLRNMLFGWETMTREQKWRRAREITRALKKRKLEPEMYDEEDEDLDDDEFLSEDFISPDESPEALNVSVPVPPVFKESDHMYLSKVLPAGRTLKLNCRAEGYPEPKIIWYKDNEEIVRRKVRLTGSDFRFRRWSLELEDVVVGDSGMYYCDAVNHLGATRRTFNVTVVNRMRRPPVILPHVLKSQNVNVNETATFRCEVLSDLHPHIMWVRLEKVNGTYNYYNDTAGQLMFNFTEVDKIENAHVHHKGNASVLTLTNASVEDQGIYACITGNSLGTAIANATLTVNEFLTVALLTGDSEPEKSTWNVALTLGIVILFLLVTILMTLIIAYLMWVRFKKKEANFEDQVGLVPKKKKIIVTHKKPDETAEGYTPGMPSTYSIQIVEQPVTTKGAGRRTRVNSENTMLSEYEVDSDPAWEITRTKLRLVDTLGEGAFGEVWRAMLKQEEADEEIPVAVKKLKISAHEKELIDLVSEMETFKIIGYHKNILRLIGCCTGNGPLYVVLELCKHGNLRNFLRAHRPKDEKKEVSEEATDYLEPRKMSLTNNETTLIPNLTQRHLVEFAWQVATGMDFLASKKIIHRDLAARNVLVADNHILKISDFGLSRDVHCNDYYRKKGNGRLPIKWMAIEALDSHVYTIESDVWSFGILLWEIMTLGGTPYPTIAMPQLFSTLKEGYRMEAPHNCPEEVYSIMVACWQEKKENRPSFSTVVSYLDWMLVQSNSCPDDPLNVDPSKLAEIVTTELSPGGFTKRRKIRPLSAPVNLKSHVCDRKISINASLQPQHLICDDDGDEVKKNRDLHNYCNSQVQLSKTDSMGGGLAVECRLAADGGYVNRSVMQADSAIGSPYISHRSNQFDSTEALLGRTTTSLLDNNYINLLPEEDSVVYTIPQKSNPSMSRSEDSAICDEMVLQHKKQSQAWVSEVYKKMRREEESTV